MKDSSNLFALLIGINYYFDNKLSDGGRYGHLYGCVRDVTQMETFLKTRMGLTDENIIKLTSSHGNGKTPLEKPSQWPTYENIVAGFQQILDKADPGDQVIIHYSGHGGRAKSIYPEEIKSSGIDEGLVPLDIGSEKGRYLRDLELAFLLNSMTDKGLLVTVFLDCCHSGGMTRGNALARGIEIIDKTERVAGTLVASSNEELISVWQQLTSGTRSNTRIMSGGLPENDDWVVVTACRPQELAYEYPFDGTNSHGALTYWLLKGLNGVAPPQSYDHLYQIVLAQVQGKFQQQRPQLYGDGSRAIFGFERIKTRFSIPVISVDKAKEQIVLNTGTVHGVTEGTRFTVFPIETNDFEDFEQTVAQVKIVQAEATNSVAKIEETEDINLIQPGAQAIMVDPANVQLRGWVHLKDEGAEGLPSEYKQILENAYQENDQKGFIEWVGPESAADFIVAKNEEECYEIWDAAGDLIPNIQPSLPMSSQDSAKKVIERLIHLTQYRNVMQLTNNDSRAFDAPQIAMACLDVPRNHIYTDGEDIKLFIHNKSDFDVEITILELSHDWSIQQIYPHTSANSYTFAPGESDTLEFSTYVASEADEERSVFKLFATLTGTNFRLLELDSLDAPQKRGLYSAQNDLEAVLSQLVDKVPSTRAVRLKKSTQREWKTRQIEIRVQR